MLLRALKWTVFIVLYVALFLVVLTITTLFTVAIVAMLTDEVGHLPIVIGMLFGAYVVLSINRVTPQRWFDWWLRA